MLIRHISDTISAKHYGAKSHIFYTVSSNNSSSVQKYVAPFYKCLLYHKISNVVSNVVPDSLNVFDKRVWIFQTHRSLMLICFRYMKYPKNYFHIMKKGSNPRFSVSLESIQSNVQLFFIKIPNGLQRTRCCL